MRDGGSQLLLVHRAVADDDNLVQLVETLLHRDIYHFPALHRLDGILETYIREDERSRRGRIDGIVAVEVGDNGLVCLVDSHADTNQGLPAWVFHLAGYLCLRRRRNSYKRRHDNCQKPVEYFIRHLFHKYI